jgi:hypothetical protein
VHQQRRQQFLRGENKQSQHSQLFILKYSATCEIRSRAPMGQH